MLLWFINICLFAYLSMSKPSFLSASGHNIKSYPITHITFKKFGFLIKYYLKLIVPYIIVWYLLSYTHWDCGIPGNNTMVYGIPVY